MDTSSGNDMQPVAELLPIPIAQEHRFASVRFELPDLADLATRPASRIGDLPPHNWKLDKQPA